jgi:hypothetical protein
MIGSDDAIIRKSKKNEEKIKEKEIKDDLFERIGLQMI